MSPPSSPPASPGPLPVHRRRLAMLAICLGVMLSGLDGIIVNVALPQIARDLSASSSGSVWIAMAYQLAVVVSLLPCAAAGESLGFRRVYLWGMAGFLAASAACALAPSLGWLVGARALQGLGGGAMIGVSMALVRAIYPPAMLGRALSLYGLVAGLSLTIGPSMAAAVLSVGPWPWLFAVNLPLGGVALGLGLWLLPATAGSKRSFDGLGAGLMAVMFVCLICGVDALGELRHVWRPLAFLGGAAVAGWVLVRQQAGQSAPMLPLDLLRGRPFTLSATTSVCTYAAQTAAFVALPFLFQHDLHLSPAATGLLVTPWPVMIVLAAPVSGQLADRLPAGVLTGVGLLGLTGGLSLLAFLPAASGAIDIVWRVALCGLGVGLFQAPNNRAMMMAAPPARSGAASGMVAVARVFGMAFGAAAAAMAFALFTSGGSRAALGVAASFAFAACVASLLRAGPDAGAARNTG